MNEFFETLGADYGRFLRYSLLAGLLASPAFGVVGTLVVTRRVSALAGAISHCILSGVGAALFFQHTLGWAWCSPLLGAFLSGTAAAGLMTWMLAVSGEREDTWISFLWSGGMAVGLIFFALTDAYVDPMSYLFGNILLIRQGDLFMLLGLNALVAVLLLLFKNLLLAVSFDPHFAKISGQPVVWIQFLFLLLVSLTIILMVQLLGVILVIALLVLPAASAGLMAKRLGWISAVASLLGAVCVFFGLFVSFILEWPTGPVIILIAGSIYLIVNAIRLVRP